MPKSSYDSLIYRCALSTYCSRLINNSILEEFMRQTCVYGIAIAAALGFAPPANAGVVNVPTMRPSLPKVIPQTPKVTPQTLKVSGAKVGTKVGPHQGHHTPQTPTVASQTPTVTPQTKVTP